MREAEESPPIIIGGSAGLTGRQQVVRVPDVEFDEEGEPVSGKGIPSNCVRCLNLGRTCHDPGGLGFSGPCPGEMRDGSCLVTKIREANTAGVDWKFAVVQEGERFWWEYAGDPIPK